MSGKAGLIAAAFSAHLGIPIKTEKEAREIETLRTERCPTCGNTRYISESVATTDLFGYSSNRFQDSDRYTVQVFGQEVGTESTVNPNSTVGDIKQAIASQNNIPTNQRQNIVLQYGGEKLDDSKTPQQQNVPLGSTLMSTTYWGGDGPHPVYYIKDSDLEPSKDYDFSNLNRFPKTCERGGYVYERPIGWDRCALKVKGKYKDDIWLGEDGWRNNSTPGEWAVSYHGTKMPSIRNISATGYDPTKSKRQMFGEGIYSTPSIEVAARYATEFTHDRMQYQMVLQNRLNLELSEEVPASATGAGAAYFVTPNEDNIRPYGVCLKGKTRATDTATDTATVTNTHSSECLLM